MRLLIRYQSSVFTLSWKVSSIEPNGSAPRMTLCKKDTAFRQLTSASLGFTTAVWVERLFDVVI